jgi:non-specific serine/threonine protein kinase
MSPTNNLPERLASFVGREREIAGVKRALASARLLTLTGTGGSGKTRLALQVGRQITDDYRDGVCFVPLAPISDPALVASAIAQTLGVKEEGGQTLLDAVAVHLADKQILLILDNFEQVIPAGLMLADLLLSCPCLKIIVTSRAALRLYGEQEFPVAPLELPDLRLSRTAEAIARCEAVILFVQRAQAVKSDFVLTNENAPAVAEICARLDGLPLAIELAAARIKLLPPQGMLARMENRLALLTGGARDLPVRQQTLRDAIGWSYDLLNAEEKALFRRASIFIGGCSLEAAEQILDFRLWTMDHADVGSPSANGKLAPNLDLLDLISSLVDKSLLKQESQEDGEPVFAMLETIREYAGEQLAESGEAEQAQRGHANYFLHLAEAAEPELRGRDQVAWLKKLEREHDNLRAAIKWALGSGESEVALRITGALARFWLQRGYLTEGRRWFEAALACAGFRDAHDGSARKPTSALARALSGLALLAYPQGEAAMSRSLLEESAAMLRELGDKAALAYTLNVLAVVVQQGGEYDLGRSLLEESLTIRRELDDRWGIAQTLNNLGELAREQGDYEAARGLYESGLEMLRQLGIKGDVAGPLHNLGSVALHLGDYARAHGYFAESLLCYQEKGLKGGIVACLAGLAGVAAASRQPERATRLYGAAEALRESIGLLFGHPDLGDYERGLTLTRTQLADAVFDAYWQEGRAMPMEQAVEFAIEGVHPPARIASSTGRTDPNSLSRREKDVLRLVASGLSDAQVANELSLSRHTVHAHLSSIYSKLEVQGRSAATRYAIDNGLA